MPFSYGGFGCRCVCWMRLLTAYLLTSRSPKYVFHVKQCRNLSYLVVAVVGWSISFWLLCLFMCSLNALALVIWLDGARKEKEQPIKGCSFAKWQLQRAIFIKNQPLVEKHVENSLNFVEKWKNMEIRERRSLLVEAYGDCLYALNCCLVNKAWTFQRMPELFAIFKCFFMVFGAFGCLLPLTHKRFP